MPEDRSLPQTRPNPADVGAKTPTIGDLQSNIRSVRVLLLVAGSGTSAVGIIVWLFIRDLSTAGLLVLAIGAVMLAIAGGLAWREVGHAVFGRRGRTGGYTLIATLLIIGIAVALNWLTFWMSNRADPAGWLRVDTTATKQFLLSDQTVSIVDDVNEKIMAIAFFSTHTDQGKAAWQDTQDLLSEFQRRSSGNFEFQVFDPQLEPNKAAEFGVTGSPAIAIQAVDSKRIQVIEGLDPLNGPQVFTETDVATALLVVTELQQKGVIFITGHGEHDITDVLGIDGFGQAVQALLRDNYAVASVTMQELGSLLAIGDESQFPAAIVFAGPETDLAVTAGIDETAILLEYLRRGGGALMLLEPDTGDSWRDVLGRFGLTLGVGQMIDQSSYVAPNPNFLQIKKSNGQFSSGHRITEPLDVVYMPAAAFVGRTVDENTVERAEDGTPYVSHSLLAQTTLASWEELGGDMRYDSETDLPGPLPVAVAVEAISEIHRAPQRVDGQWVKANLVVIGDSDFATNSFFSSAKNGDLLANSVNWLARDFELISTRPKTRVFRELVLTQRERDFVRWTGWLLMPALVGSLGVASWWRRR